MKTDNRKALFCYGLASGMALVSMIYQQLVLIGYPDDWNLFLTRYRVNNIGNMSLYMLVIVGTFFIDKDQPLIYYVRFAQWIFLTIGCIHIISNIIGIAYHDLYYIFIGLALLWTTVFILYKTKG